MNKSPPIASLLPLSASILLGISLQVYWTPIFGHTSIRICLADIVLALFGLPIIIALARSSPKAFIFKNKSLFLWLSVLTAWLGVSFAKSYFTLGFLDPWAVKKLLGWLVCLTYAIVGLWLGQQSEQTKVMSIKSLLITHSIIIFGCLLTKFLGYQSANWISGWRLAGFFQNPNAFGLFCVTALILMLSLSGFSVILRQCLMLLSTLGALYSNSRVAVLSLLIVVLTQRWWRQKFSVPAGIIVACLIFGMGYVSPQSSSVHFAPAREDLLNKYQENMIDHGVAYRIQISLQGLEMWQAQPLTGIGLGRFLQKQISLGINDPTELHSSYLWLLVETGLIGLLLMGIVFFVVFKKFFLKQANSPPTPYIVAFKGIMIAFATAALTMEILYQRYLWLFFGLALAHYGRSAVYRFKADDTFDTNSQSLPNPAQYPSAA